MPVGAGNISSTFKYGRVPYKMGEKIKMVSYSDFQVDPIELAKAARKRAEADPGFIYTSANYDPEFDDNGGCFYTERTGKPGCIFGHAMDDLGMKLPAHETDEYTLVGALTNSYIDGSQWTANFGLSPYHSNPVVAWMRAVQGYQDQRKTWGEAVRMADEAYPEVASLTS